MRERSGFRSYRSWRTFSHTKGVLERKSWNQKEKNKAWRKDWEGRRALKKRRASPTQPANETRREKWEYLIRTMLIMKIVGLLQ